MEDCNSVLGIFSAQINAPTVRISDIQCTYDAVKIRRHVLLEKQNRAVNLMVEFVNHSHKSMYKKEED